MITRVNLDTITKILERAELLFKEYGIDEKRINTLLDLDNADNEIPLDWDALLTCDKQTFAHDIFGIRRHMNRKTGKIEDCFVPRTALLQDTDGTTGQF